MQQRKKKITYQIRKSPYRLYSLKNGQQFGFYPKNRLKTINFDQLKQLGKQGILRTNKIQPRQFRKNRGYVRRFGQNQYLARDYSQIDPLLMQLIMQKELINILQLQQEKYDKLILEHKNLRATAPTTEERIKNERLVEYYEQKKEKLLKNLKKIEKGDIQQMGKNIMYSDSSKHQSQQTDKLSPEKKMQIEDEENKEQEIRQKSPEKKITRIISSNKSSNKSKSKTSDFQNFRLVKDQDIAEKLIEQNNEEILKRAIEDQQLIRGHNQMIEQGDQLLQNEENFKGGNRSQTDSQKRQIKNQQDFHKNQILNIAKNIKSMKSLMTDQQKKIYSQSLKSGIEQSRNQLAEYIQSLKHNPHAKPQYEKIFQIQEPQNLDQSISEQQEKSTISKKQSESSSKQTIQSLKDQLPSLKEKVDQNVSQKYDIKEEIQDLKQQIEDIQQKSLKKKSVRQSEEQKEIFDQKNQGFGFDSEEGISMNDLVHKIEHLINLSDYKLYQIDGKKSKIPQLQAHENCIILIQRDHHFSVIIFNYDQEEVCFFDPMGQIDRYQEDQDLLYQQIINFSPTHEILCKYSLIDHQKNKKNKNRCGFLIMVFLWHYINMQEHFSDASGFNDSQQKLFAQFQTI